MRTTLVLAFTIAALALSTVASATVRVVATLPDLCAIAEEIGGDHVDVSCLVEPGEDPHFVDPRPSFVVALTRADLLIANGAELEVGWLPTLQQSARNRRILVGGQGFIRASDVVEVIHSEGRADRSRGDVHAGGNPHFSFSPRHMIPVADAIADRLSTIDADHAADYASALSSFTERAQAFADEQAQRFANLSSRRIVTYHESLAYLLEWLGLEQAATIEPLPGVAPNPRHVANVVQAMRAGDIRVIAQERYYPHNTADRIASLTSASVVLFCGGTESGSTYLDHVRQNVDALYDALSGAQ